MSLVIQNNTRRYTFDSLAGLRLLSGQKLQDNQVVDISGHTTEGDGGGGDFFWDSSSTATDNNGTIVKLADTTTGRFIRVDQTRISVRMFGAVGNGSTDDYTAIQAAINSISSVGGTIFFPVGDYLINTQLIVTTPGTQLVGDGIDSTWNTPSHFGSRIIGGNTTGAVIWIKVESCTVSNLVIDASTTRRNAALNLTQSLCNAGIRVEATDVAAPNGDVFDTTLERVFVRYQPGDGILLIGRIYGSYLNHCIVEYSGSNSQKSHGISINSGERTSRNNEATPGLVNVNGGHSSNNDGHGLALGSNTLDSAVTLPSFRIVCINFETFNNNVSPGNRYAPYDVFARGDNNLFLNCAFTGTNKAGTVKSHGGLAISGRDSKASQCRYLDCTRAARIMSTDPDTVATAQAGSSTTFTLAAGSSAVDDFYNADIISLTGGTGSGQTREITDYVGSTKVATVASAWATIPNATTTYITGTFPSASPVTTGTTLDQMSVRNSADSAAVSVDAGVLNPYIRVTDTNGGITAATDTTQRFGEKVQYLDAVTSNQTYNAATFSSGRSVVIADDAVGSFVFDADTYGMLSISSNTAAAGGALILFKVGASNFTTLLAGNNVEVGTGIPTGTTGTDGKLRVSTHTDDTLYVENRTSASHTYRITLLNTQGGKLNPGQ